MPLLMSQRETRLLGSPLAENEKYKTAPKYLTVGELPVLPHMGRKYIAWISGDANNSNKNGSVACGNTLVMQEENWQFTANAESAQFVASPLEEENSLKKTPDF